MIHTLKTVLSFYNSIALRVSMLAMVVTSAILTYSVIVRYFFKVPTDWQDEASVFLLVGVIFFCAAYVQSIRGHIAIDVLHEILPEKIDKYRQLLVDFVSLLFCALFTWKSWVLCLEAIEEGQTTATTFASPLWIPYSTMSIGMTFLTLQILQQILEWPAKKSPS